MGPQVPHDSGDLMVVSLGDDAAVEASVHPGLDLGGSDGAVDDSLRHSEEVLRSGDLSAGVPAQRPRKPLLLCEKKYSLAKFTFFNIRRGILFSPNIILTRSSGAWPVTRSPKASR